jgi:NADPH:quinone reductase-like Zn-dependent oxidoreductase
MATHTALAFRTAGSPFEVIDDIPNQTPGPKQALVKCLYVAINPVEIWQASTGAFVSSLPGIIGSDCAGVVVEVGEGCTKLQKGDHVYGASRLGVNEYQPFQEFYLVDEELTHKLAAGGIAPEAAATIPTGALTTILGLVAPWNAAFPEAGTTVAPNDEWVIILGGSGTVGHFAIEIARLCGYKVAASSSTPKAELVLKTGAETVFDNRASLEEQAEKIKAITGGKFSKIFDASGKGNEVAVEAFKHSTESAKYFTSVNDSSAIKVPDDIQAYSVLLPLIGREEDAMGAQVSKVLKQAIPLVEAHVDRGTITPVDYDLFEKTGWEGLKEAMAFCGSGQAAKKVVVKVQDP